MPSLKIFRNETEEENQISSNLAIGRPNVGKSSDQCDPRRRPGHHAKPVYGTTRDAIDTHFTDADGQKFP